jgi:uncharacterized protein YjaG (DUF416 family)
MTTGNKVPIGFDQWLRSLKEELPKLSYAKNLAFAASCCERSLPNYKVFSREEQWGEPAVLIEASELIWRSITIPNSVEIRSYAVALLKALEAVVPDTEQGFESMFTSAALDAANSLAETIDYILDGNTSHIESVASLARDTIYLFVHYRGDSDLSRGDVENQISRDPLNIAEVEKQQSDIKVLKSTDDLTSEFLLAFRGNALASGRSNLGILL